jgi:hypothetical protein
MSKKKKVYSSLLFLLASLLLVIGWIVTLFWVVNSYESIIGKISSPLFRPAPRDRIAIILDDGGYSLDEELIELLNSGFPLTISILPFRKYSEELAEIAHSAGCEVMLHLPMEPSRYPRVNPGKCAIFTDMADDRIREKVKEAISAVPYAVGVNNHMGSLATADARVMRIVLGEIKREGLYFVDSFTTPKSVVREISEEIGIKSGVRNIFLDNKEDYEYIMAQFELLIERAHRDGEAIGIGHIHNRATISVLKDILPTLKKRRIEIVPVSAIVR